MATSVTLKPNAIDISGSTSGTTTLQASAVAGTTTLTLPAATDTLVGKATTDTLTNKTLTGAAMNGTLGATTPSTASVTTLTTSSTVTHSGGTANGVAYLDGSKVLTTGSALVFDGTNLGVGVTPSAWNSVYRSIQLGSTAGISGRTESNLLELSSNSYRNSGGAWTYLTTSSAARYDIASGVHNWYNAPSGTAGNAITFTQAMTLDASGNLGVGTTSPASRLNVVATASTIGQSRIEASGVGSLFSGMTAGSIGFIHSNTGTLAFGTSTTDNNLVERARIDSSGSFFVGASSLSGNAVQIYNNSNQAGRININKTTSGLFNALVNTYSGTTVGGINYDNTSTSFPTSSDVRMKKDIVDAGSASAKIDQIRIVSHGWKHDDAVVEFGVIAQELVNVAPQAVSAGDDGEEVEVTWGVDYSKLVPMLIKAHQEQQAIITQLQADVASLKGA